MGKGKDKEGGEGERGGLEAKWQMCTCTELCYVCEV